MSEFKQWRIEYDESGWPLVSDGKRVITSDIGGETQQEDVAIAEQIVSDHNIVPALQRQLREARQLLWALAGPNAPLPDYFVTCNEDQDEVYACIYCDAGGVVFYHKPDCPWLLAKQYLEREATE